MDLLQAYSNPGDQVERLRSLLELPAAARSRTTKSAPKQAQRRLHAEEIAQLVAEHQAGTGTTKLAERYGIHRETVRDILRRNDAHRPPGIQPDDIPEIIHLYEDGWSLARIAKKYHVAADTVSRTLRSHGVRIRRPSERPPVPVGSRS